jgi:orotate phosphoribosyltransferase
MKRFSKGAFSSAMTDTLRELLVKRALRTGETVTLSTGRLSNFYFDCKPVTLSQEGASLVADAFLAKLMLLPEPVEAVGGRTLGADPIVMAIMMRARQREEALDGFFVREKKKTHGTQELIANAPPPGTPVAIVDDVVTTGRSVIEAIDAAQAAGCRVVGVIVLLDRQEEGGEENIRKRVQHYFPVYTRQDFPEIDEARSPTTAPPTAMDDSRGEISGT